MTFRISLLCSVALASISSVTQAADGTLTITGNQNDIYIATDKVSGSSFDNFTATSNSATFKKDLIGTQNKNVVNQTINFSGGTAGRDIVGLYRDKGNINISRTNTINISGGTIEGDILATEDSGNYKGSLRRTSNNINISGGKIGGNVEGGAGAESNVITITGGQFTPFSAGDDDDGGSCGDQSLGAIYAGVSNASTRNQSKDGTVILKDMTSTNSFLISFQEGTDNVSGTIFGSNLTGTSNMQFNNVKGTFSGGLRDFNNVSVDANSQLTLGGKSYYADNWNVAGSLDTNGKTIHAYKNSTINLNVANTGSLSKQFISDANVNAENQGNINGIQTNKNISLNNSGKMTGNYNGATVNIINTGIINSQAGQTTSITSQNAGVLNNTGQIKEKLTVAGAMTINNNVGGNINAQIQNQQNVLNISNLGTISASSLQNQGNKTINLENKSGGVISNSLALTNGTLNLTNNSGGSLSGNALSSNGGVFNIANFGAMNGNTSLSASNGGSFSLINQASGSVSGNLTINSGLSQFENKGSFQDLYINNLQNGTILSNLGTISGTGSILSDSLFTLNNSGNISGTQTWKNVNLANAGNVNNLDLTADSGNVAIANDGIISGNISLSASNGGSFSLINQASGLVSGNLTIASGLNQFENKGSFQDLHINNLQNGTILSNLGTISGTGSILSDSLFTLNNSGNISGTQTWKNVNLANAGNVNNLDLTADSGNVAIANDGIISGNTSLSASNGGSFSLINQAPGSVSGNLTIASGLNQFENKGSFQDLHINNLQNGTILSNLGTISGTGSILSDSLFILNNSGNISGTQTWKNVNLANAGNVNNLDLTADSGNVAIANDGIISGTNSIKSANGGTVDLLNNTNGTISGNLTIASGLNQFENKGSFQDLHINNQQNGTILSNLGTISGTGSILSDSLFILNNSGNISGTQTWKNVNLANAGNVNNLDLTADSGNVAITNDGIISGINSIKSANGGTVDLLNNTNGTISGNLTLNTTLAQFENNGLLQNLNLSNMQTNTLTNSATGTVQNVAFATDTKDFILNNSGIFLGNNQFSAQNGGSFSFVNNTDGKVSGQFSVLSGLESLDNQGMISDWTLSADMPNFEIDNTGEISGTNLLATNDTVTLNNNGKSSGDLVLNNTSLVVNHDSSTVLNNNFIGFSGTENVEIDNAVNSSVTSSFAGNLGALTLKNNNSDLDTVQMSLTNNARINGDINLKNLGYTQLTNNALISGNITDNLTQVADNQCLVNKFDLTNNGSLSGDISVMNNIFNFTNNASGVVTSEHVDARELYLNNAGTFQNTSDYTFGVQNYINLSNSGTINGGDMVLKLTGDDVKGQISNTGTIWSYGTTIGMADNLVSCPNCGFEDSLKLYNSGTLMAVDPVDFVIPDMNSYAVNVPTMDVYNQNGGVIGGSLNVNNYTQDGGSTWVAFMDKDKSLMSTITAQNEISIAPGSILYIHTNNDVTKFTDGQTFQIVNAQGMSEDEVKTQLNNYTLKTDTPFATYEMTNDENNGYIVFNKVAPTKFADATDMTTANHNNLASGSHRLFELFVNRNMKSTPLGLSSGDDVIRHTHVAFMPVAGHAEQDDSADNVGYKSNYYGGIGYIEHDFTPAFKTGLGLSYLNNSTDYNDMYQSTSTVDSYRPFAYLNYNDMQWRFDFVAGWGKHKIKNNRRYAFDDKLYIAHSDYDSEEYSAHFSGGYRFYLEDDLIIQPMLGLFAANIKTDTYEERGSGPMNMHVESEDYNSLKTMVGVKAKKEYKLDNGMVFKPEVHVRWYHELGDRQGGVNAYFLAQQELFSSQGIEAPKDITDVAFRLTTENDEDLDIFVESFYQFGKDFYNIGGTVGLRYNF